MKKLLLIMIAAVTFSSGAFAAQFNGNLKKISDEEILVVDGRRGSPDYKKMQFNVTEETKFMIHDGSKWTQGEPSMFRKSRRVSVQYDTDSMDIKKIELLN